jgi:UDP-N-acetylmuramate--L-alanine ligase
MDTKGHLFFLGIAGHAMGGLALAASKRGFTVTGLDETAGPPMSDWLTAHHLDWTTAYSSDLLATVTAIVISGHHGKPDHPVIQYAKQNNIPIMSFAELVGQLTKGERVIAVAGTHGKTTTTSLITWILESAGRHPDYLVGIKPYNFDSSSRLDGSKYAVIEADEYKASTLDSRPKFSYYHPDVLVLGAIEHDHPDIYPTMSDYTAAFDDLVRRLPKSGQLVACADQATVMAVSQKASCPVITYGLNAGDYTAKAISYLPEGLAFTVVKDSKPLGDLKVSAYGPHNVVNSLAAAAVCLSAGLSFEEIQTGAAGFKGAYRRTNLLTPPSSPILVVDDYAHHPTEAKAMIQMMKLHFPNRRLLVVYRPHTYSRTQTLMDSYHHAFSGVDRLYITDVEPAREAATQRTVSGQEIIDGLPETLRTNSVFEPDRTTLIDRLKTDAKPGDMILCMTVSGYQNLANDLAGLLN